MTEPKGENVAGVRSSTRMVRFEADILGAIAYEGFAQGGFDDEPEVAAAWEGAFFWWLFAHVEGEEVKHLLDSKVRAGQGGILTGM